MAGEAGLEPTMSESKSDVLPVTPFPLGWCLREEWMEKPQTPDENDDNGT